MKAKLHNHPLYGYRCFDPLPSKEETEKYYREEFYSSAYPGCNDSSKEKQQIDYQHNRERFEDLFQLLEIQMGNLTGKSLFDIGCGYGELLLYARERGLNVTGLEVAPEAVEYLEKEKNLPIFLADIDGDFSAIAGEKRYDIVTLLNVLEHLRDPALTLRNIREYLLVPEGCLVVDVPNEFNPLQTAANDLFLLKEWWLSYPVHLNYFNPESLTSLMQACGFEVKDIIASFPLEIFLLMGDIYVGDSELGRECHNRRVLFEHNMRKAGKRKELLDFYRYLAKNNMGRQIVCIAKQDSYTVPVSPKRRDS